MTDPTAAAERVMRVITGEPHQTVYDLCLGDAMRMYAADWETMAAAYLSQQPTYAEQAAELAELRGKLAAAEEIESELRTIGEYVGHSCDVSMVGIDSRAIDYLVEVESRADKAESQLAAFADTTLVDEAWCREKFGEPEYRYGGVNFNRIVINTSGGLVIDADFNSEGTSLILVRNGRFANGLIENPTRGQLAKLLSALGAT
jgi:hypothetical protein